MKNIVNFHNIWKLKLISIQAHDINNIEIEIFSVKFLAWASSLDILDVQLNIVLKLVDRCRISILINTFFIYSLCLFHFEFQMIFNIRHVFNKVISFSNLHDLIHELWQIKWWFKSHLWMLLRVGKKWKYLSHFRKHVIDCEFSYWASICPIVLQINHVDLKILFQNCIYLFSLVISFWVIRSWEMGFNFQLST